MKIRICAAWILALSLVACGGQPGPSDTETDSAARLENGSFTAELNGFQIHYEVHGRGPVLMTVPNSWGLTLEGLRGLYRPLEEHVTMVYFDPRGMGGSEAIREDDDMSMDAVRADFDALRRHLGLERVHAIGWSNGAMNLLLLASERPETLSSAIFLHGAASFSEEDTTAMTERYPELFERYGALEEELTHEEIPDSEKDARIRQFWVEEWFPLSTADPETARGILAELYRDVRFSWRHAQYTNRQSSFDARDRLGRITVPSLILAGAADMLPPAKAEEIQAGIPGSRLVVLETSGHFGPVEEPEAFAAAVLDFLGVS